MASSIVYTNIRYYIICRVAGCSNARMDRNCKLEDARSDSDCRTRLVGKTLVSHRIETDRFRRRGDRTVTPRSGSLR
jgi:hypothetical protein